MSCGLFVEAKDVLRLAKAGSRIDTPAFRRKHRRDCASRVGTGGRLKRLIILLGGVACENGAFDEMDE